MSLVQGTRKPFEEFPSSDLDSQSKFDLSSEDDSDEQDETDESPWEISASSDDESNPQNVSKLLDKGYNVHTPPVGPVSNQQPDHAMSLIQKPTLEMPNLLVSIDFVVICLYKLPIRRPISIDQDNQKFSVEASFYQPFDILYVRDKFPRLQLDIATRLGKMITRRRQLLFNRLSHDHKLKTTEVEPKVALGVPSATKPLSPEYISSGLKANDEASVGGIARSQAPGTQYTIDTYATTVRKDPFKFKNTDLYAPSSAESKSSMASSYANENMRVEVPPRPKGKNGKELNCFECQYCLVTQFIKTERTWK